MYTMYFLLHSSEQQASALQELHIQKFPFVVHIHVYMQHIIYLSYHIPQDKSLHPTYTHTQHQYTHTVTLVYM